MRAFIRVSACLCALFLFQFAGNGATFYGPLPYLSFVDSPFGGGSFLSFVVSDFENGSTAVAGVTMTPGVMVLNPASLTDSVDGDDGSIDGSGSGGHSLYSGSAGNAIRFTFNPAAFGGTLPTHAGIVLTDIGIAIPTTGFGDVTFEAFGPTFLSLGTIGPAALGDGYATGQTAEDRFFGVSNASGISAIEIRVANSTDFEVDHLQFGVEADPSVPEPSTWMIVGCGLLLGLARLLCKN